MDIRKLLEDWNCEASVIKTFVEDNKFDEESFLLLDAATIESLIPEKGPLLKFKHKFQTLLQSVAKLNDPLQFSEKETHHISDENLTKKYWIREDYFSHLAKDPLCQEESFGNVGSLKRQRLSLDAEEIELEKADFIILDSNLELPNREQISQEDFPDITINESSNVLLESSQYSQDKPNSNQKTTSHIESRILNPVSVGKKRPFDDRPEEPAIFPHGLKAFLEKDIDGRIALIRGDILDKKSRSFLVKAVVNYLFRLFSRKNLIDKEIFIRAAHEIHLAFPTESEKTYFIAGKPKTKTSARTLHKGKLYNRYINVKHALGGTARNDENASEDKGVSDTELEENTEKLAERSTALQYLKKSVGLASEQANNWKICFKDRSDLLENHTIYEYFRLFPILRTQFGYELLMQDFNRIYQGQKDALYTVWDPLARAITALCIGRGVISPEVAKNLNEIEDAFLVKYMPLLFHPGTVKNEKTKKNFRPSNDEMIETFCLHVHGFDSAEDYKLSVICLNFDAYESACNN